MGAVARLQKVIAGIGEHGPVIMLAAAVDACKRLFREQAVQVVPAGNFLHDLHGQLVMVTGHVGD